MPSIWTRRFPNPSLRAVRWFLISGGLALVFLMLTAQPLYGIVKWAFHRTVTTYGITIKMPFRWVVDEDQSSVTFEKPESFFVIHDFGPDISVTRFYGTPARDGNAIMLQEWTQIHKTIRVSPPRRLQHGNLSVICADDALGAHCLSSDAIWSFSYSGKATDFPEALEIIWDILAQSPPSR